MPNVTAIIPTYNRSRYLAEALRSVIGQTVPPHQIIVVDDGSTDGTKSVLAPFRDTIEYIYKKNGGKSAALNFALSRVRGSAVWIFDDDDLAEPNALELLSRELIQDPNIDFVYAKHSEFYIDDDGNRRRTIRGDGLPDDIHQVALHRCAVFQGAMLVRTDCYNSVGPFDESLIRAQDYDMLLRLARRFRGAELSDVVFHQRMHPGLRGSATSPIRRHDQYRAQRRFEQAIFRKIHAEYALKEFGRSGPSNGVKSRVEMLVERATVMGRKGLWDLAEEDIRNALLLETLSEVTIWSVSSRDTLAAMFDESSVGLSEFVKAASFHRLLRETWFSPLTRTMCHIFSASLKARANKAFFGQRSYLAVSLTAALSCIVFARFTLVSSLCRLLLGMSDAARQAGQASPDLGTRSGVAGQS